MKKEVILLMIVISQINALKLFKRIKRKKDDQDGCDLKLGQKCELFEGGRHNCRKQDGLTCALFCDKDKVGDCQYWCVLKVGQQCSRHSDCLYEYCSKNGECAKRKELGFPCEIDQECFSFKCQQKICAGTDSNPCDKINQDNPIVDPKIDDIIDDLNQYDSSNGKQIDVDFPLNLSDPDDYFNDSPNELLSRCSSDKDCQDQMGVSDLFGTSTLACQQGKCRLKPGEFCYPGNDNLPYICFNKNRCEKRYVLRKFRDEQKFNIYNSILEMTENRSQQQSLLNQWLQKISRIEQLGQFDSVDQNIPKNGQPFYLTYQCVVRQRYECTDDKFCSNHNCVPLEGPDNQQQKKVCKDKAEDENCEQHFECALGNCAKLNQIKTCQPKIADNIECDYDFQCKSHNCRRYQSSYFVQEIKQLLQKECQMPNSLPLNAKCQVSKQCSKTEIIDDGTSRSTVQLKCIESNIVNNKEDKEKAIEAIKFYYNNRDKGESLGEDIKNEEINQLDEKLTNNDLEKTIDSNFIFKCKVPKGEACVEDHQCGFNYVCHQRVCRGDENAFCKNKQDCKGGMICIHNSDKKSPFYRRRICQKNPYSKMFDQENK